MVKVVAKRAVIVACIIKENMMMMQLQCTRLYRNTFYGRHSGNQSFVFRAHHWAASGEESRRFNSMYSTWEVHSPAMHDRNVGGFFT
jgi:hypothetical protein